MADVLDYAVPPVQSPSRWPYVTVAVVGSGLASVMLGVHCVGSILNVSAESRFERNDAWARMFLSAPWCLVVLAGAWWVAGKVHWNINALRWTFWICTAVWLLTLAGMGVMAVV